MAEPKNILITGASSGLGEALALAYSMAGVTLFLSGRHAERLEAVARQTRQRGAKTETAVLDVTDEQAMKEWIERADDLAPLDLVIANAGVSAGTGKGEESEAQAKEIFATNLYGVFYTIWPIVERMKKRGQGQIALMSSLAGFRGIPGAPSYAASKAAVRVYGEALRGELATHGVKVNVICPGFVKTRMTDVNDFPMPFLMSAERAAQIMKRGMASNKPRIAYPWQMAAVVGLLTALQLRWTDALFAKLPRKG